MIWYRNDYEMLLALDDTNGLHHSGASRNQIERLPISVIQVNIWLQEFFIPISKETYQELSIVHVLIIVITPLLQIIVK